MTFKRSPLKSLLTKPFHPKPPQLYRYATWNAGFSRGNFNLLLRIILGLKYKDTQCGFKAFTRKAAHQIFSRQMIDRWGFDPEVLFLAEKYGFKVAEVPVEWAHDNRSKINPVVDGFKMFTEMLRVRWADLNGKYDRGVTMYAAS